MIEIQVRRNGVDFGRIVVDDVGDITLRDDGVEIVLRGGAEASVEWTTWQRAAHACLVVAYYGIGDGR